ncbi:uncharacterized protein LOC102800698 [Saccoglossus kowalevskii]|uniref:Uncharacterized protein LOC102800698 n=1 Tax=Saccoglossus kowalevskii TaxID=10224 RepID=A0ABM0M4R8_SACKO|nr:PREDICTED: uncharacterized protein LOC102800698 [Saccoglossus kowalevskii]
MGDWAEKQRLREAVIDAVKREDINSVRSFLNDGADINVCEGGYLAKKNLLMMAIDRRNIDISLLLVERGIDLNFSRTIEKEEKTAFDLAKDKKLNEVTDAIERKSSANEDLMRAISIGVTELAVHALDAGADINLIVNVSQL